MTKNIEKNILDKFEAWVLKPLKIDIDRYKSNTEDSRDYTEQKTARSTNYPVKQRYLT